MKRMATMAIGSLLVAGVAGAQTPDGAEPEAGARVRVRLEKDTARARGARQLTGRLVEIQAERIVVALEQDGRKVDVTRSTIERLDVSEGRKNRGRAALKGAGIGVGLGLAATGVIALTCEGWDCFGAGGMLMFGTPVAGALGAGVGALAGEERWQPVEGTRRGPRLTLAPTVGQGVGARLALSF